MAAAAGAIIGYFCVRLSGIYFGMLTFAFQMLVYTIVFKSYELTGGDDGLSGHDMPRDRCDTPQGFYYLTLVVVAAGTLAAVASGPLAVRSCASRATQQRSQEPGARHQCSACTDG